MVIYANVLPLDSALQVLKHVGTETMVTHEVSAETVGNLIGQRDFLSVRHVRRTPDCVYLGGAATHLEALPPQSGFVRYHPVAKCVLCDPDTFRVFFGQDIP